MVEAPKKIALFVDVQNIYYTVKEAYNCHFNYSVFWDQICSRGEIVKANAYAVNRGDRKQLQFQQILKNIGFEVKLKPFIQRSDGSAKADWDVGITIDVIDCAPEVDIVILASGDGDFDILVEKIQDRYGVQVEVYGVPNLTANSLIQAADQYNPIEGNLLLGYQK